MNACLAVLACALPALLLCCAVQAQPSGPPGPTQPDSPRFDILEFVVEGDTLLGSAAIERAVYPFLGPGRSVADAEGARQALEAAYQAAGFLSVTVLLPAQRIDQAGGELRLQVLQAPVARLRVTGAEYSLPSALRAAVPSLAPGNVPNFNEMQQELGDLARRSADRELTPLLAAGTRPGTLDVELKLQETLPLHGAIELNSKRVLNTEPGRLAAGLRYDNLFQRGHSLGFDWLYSPRRPAQANIQSLLYHLPLGAEGDRLFVTLTHSNSDTPTALGGATVSRGDTLRLRWRDVLGPVATTSQSLSWGLTLRDLRDGNRGVAGFVTPSSPLRYPSFSLGWELDLPGTASTPGRLTRLQAELTLGLRGLGARTVDCNGVPKDQFDCKRAGAQPGFQVITFNLSHQEPLGRWRLLARLQGQLSDAPLVSAEQVVYGGEASVRGYFEGEQAGDIGAALRLELSAPPWVLPAPSWARTDTLQLQALLFHDLARLQRLEPLPGEQAKARLASAGLGLRLNGPLGLQAELTWSHVLQATGLTDGAGQRQTTTARGQRWDVSLRQSF